MRFYVNNFCYLSAENKSSLTDGRHCFDKHELPKLDWVAPMQRRRLSAFTKMALYCASEANRDRDPIPVVFSSRHGDLHKTASLLDSLALNESLSPARFSMSVHNASAGLLSILTNNKAASNTVSAGKESLLMAIIDAYAKLMNDNNEQVLVVHCDQALPIEYIGYQDEKQIDHCLAFIMSKNITTGEELIIEHREQSALDENTILPHGIVFGEFLTNKHNDCLLHGRRSNWFVKAIT
ncbi:beta-ketoacyl synthase chain length factor [Thalassotalea sp. 1_MG-2023]|uniref:beta-ketoacyl synthase chain length factor n=1 Tax=Thalassotalea sp. 1_MG-2023 TaxID=3062680 RepID=UPI0026E34BE2|nr:beta-ketoacyl synthase chain length factor [Thalassotalea sp. 1_MG-2023]MDO6426630.1 beta-ketoacyl synthase chain length factor [Thalassotalea sp. 1_MG-2023]